jgi:hypothetical protein
VCIDGYDTIARADVPVFPFLDDGTAVILYLLPAPVHNIVNIQAEIPPDSFRTQCCGVDFVEVFYQFFFGHKIHILFSFSVK